MAGSTFGERLKMTTFGESHGEAVGVILEGVTPGVELDEAYIQIQMDRRRPGQSSVTTPRKEYDKIRIVSGLFEGKTTGTPLCIMLNNTDMRPSAYDTIKSAYRPGHADFTYEKNTGFATIEEAEELREGRRSREWSQEPWRGSFWNVGVSPSWRIRPRSEVSDASNLTPMLSNGMQFVRVIRKRPFA